jgi:cytoplasmic iron level regulating protein YaaA (DUF328/UPF0246 family)
MKIIISPAKRLDFESKAPVKKYTQPVFTDESETLIKILREKSVNELKDLMDLSSDLAQLNHERYAQWQLPFNEENAKQALFAFEGDVFKALDKESLDKSDIDYLQEHLRILSGLHGVLRPLDLIQPHRLEGGTKLETDKGDNLYKFWGNKITDFIREEIENDGDKILINLASNEYFKYIKKKKLNADILNLNFKEYKNGKLKTIAIYAKKARGMMLHYISKNRINKTEDLKGFDYDGYAYSEEHSKNKNELMFIR